MLGNIERTSGLYLTKTSYAMLLALATGVSRFAFPFLPRHLSLVAATDDRHTVVLPCACA